MKLENLTNEQIKEVLKKLIAKVAVSPNADMESVKEVIKMFQDKLKAEKEQPNKEMKELLAEAIIKVQEHKNKINKVTEEALIVKEMTLEMVKEESKIEEALEVKDLLSSLIGDDRLDASAIKNLPMSMSTGGWNNSVAQMTAEIAVPMEISLTSDVVADYSWNGKVLIINNDSTTRTITTAPNMNFAGLKTNAGTITFVAGSGRTISGDTSFTGEAGGRFSVLSDDIVDYISIQTI